MPGAQMGNEGLLACTGRYRMKADTIRPRGPNLELVCEDEFQSSEVRLVATFFVREEDFEQELAIRGLVPPETMLASKLHSPQTLCMML